jgi:hypothetical protein
MRFFAPSLLLGLLAAALPYFVHRIGRRRANPLRFAAMELLVRAERQVAARRRLRDALLLVVRTAAAAVLPLLFARPYAEVRSDLPAMTDRPQSAAIVLDDSASLQRRRGAIGSGTVFDSARAQARTLLENMAPQSDVALVLGSEGARANRGAVDRSTASAGCGRRADLLGGTGRSHRGAGAGRPDPANGSAPRAADLSDHRPAGDRLRGRRTGGGGRGAVHPHRTDRHHSSAGGDARAPARARGRQLGQSCRR